MKTARAKAWRSPKMVKAQRVAVVEVGEGEEDEGGEGGMMMGLRRAEWAMAEAGRVGAAVAA